MAFLHHNFENFYRYQLKIAIFYLMIAHKNRWYNDGLSARSSVC